MYQDDYDVVGGGVDTTLSGLEERRPLTLLQIPERDGDASVHSSTSDLGSPIYERRGRQHIVTTSILLKIRSGYRRNQWRCTRSIYESMEDYIMSMTCRLLQRLTQTDV